MAPPTTHYKRKVSETPPLFLQCTKRGCLNPVQVYVCTGSNYAHHQGYSYEACVNEHNTSDNHFLTWRLDIPPQFVSDLVRYEACRGVLPELSPKTKSCMSIQQLLDQRTEARPFKPFPPSPARISIWPPSTDPQAKRHAALESLFDFSEALSIEIPDQTLTEEEALSFSQQLDQAEEDVIPSPTNISPDSAEIPSGALDESSISTLNEKLFINGSYRNVCLGRNCFGKPDAKRAKVNDNCSFKLCKTCCALYQIEASCSCKEAVHKPATAKSSSGGPNVMYTHLRPLQLLHYQHRDQAHIDHHERSKILQNRNTYADHVKRNILIKFWAADGSQDMLTVECSTYPFFCFDDCSVAVREVIGAIDGKLVWVYDPQAKGWPLQESKQKRLLWDGEVLLVRANGCTPSQEMEEAEKTEINRLGNLRKRKLAADIPPPSTPSQTPSGASSQPRSTVTPSRSPSQFDSHVTLAPSTHLSLFLSPFPPPTTPRHKLQTVRDLSESPDLPDQSSLFICATSPTPLPKAKKAKTILAVTNKPMQVIDLTEPNSRHRSWPYKLYRGMHDGFTQLDENRRLKHDNVFPKTSAQTKSLQRAAWANGTPELKERFYKDPHSTWRDYIQEVKNMNGGSLPKYQAGRKIKQEARGSLSRVKLEDFSPEIISLDSD
ncbi:uncharacterized protein C8R40DRAFT_1068239 [Lentinula edodes]|uniref:uncharacterized protein n=1 Tax=Lentinula edodes TaxID=5353 RepID=UPI001E8E84DE|nr:uncharacterized protein C8R40DRAFT_1068239 [Lentinula edodes]KAH7877020.1 hypothetical protein C8R40DRAFT_1068239 [Lentinula edodes]